MSKTDVSVSDHSDSEGLNSSQDWVNPSPLPQPTASLLYYVVINPYSNRRTN